MKRTILLGCLLCVALVRAADPPAEATAHPASMIVKGIADDGTIHVVARKAITLSTARQFKRLTIAAPDIAEISAIGPTQILLTGLKQGETSLTVWDDNNVPETMDVRVSAPLGGVQAPKAGKWDIAMPPLSASSIPGFVRINLSKASLDVSLGQIAAVVTEGEGETFATRIVFAPNGSSDFPRELSIPAKVQTAKDVLDVLARVAKLKP